MFTIAATALSLTSVHAQSNLKLERIPGIPSASKPPYAPKVQLPTSGLSTIYSSFGQVYAEYYPGDGWDIDGTGAAAAQQSIGMPFTPAADATIYVIDAALQYISGTNTASFSVYNDAGGLPGTAIQTFTISNFSNYEGSCCNNRAVVATAGVPVKAGTQYWIVLSAAPSVESFSGAWSFNYAQENGNFAFNQGSGWLSYNGAISAFGVYGLLTQ